MNMNVKTVQICTKLSVKEILGSQGEIAYFVIFFYP